MKPRHRRFLWIAIAVAIVAIAIGLILKAFNSNMVFFITPSQVVENEVQGKGNDRERAFRLGGLVVADSLKRQSDALTVRFEVTDTAKTIPVSFTGILPDLFREGKGVVAQGKMGADGVFYATEVLAKHDENYMPPEAAEALRKAGHPIDGKIFAGQQAVVTQAAKP